MDLLTVIRKLTPYAKDNDGNKINLECFNNVEETADVYTFDSTFAYPELIVGNEYELRGKLFITSVTDLSETEEDAKILSCARYAGTKIIYTNNDEFPTYRHFFIK